MRAPARNRLIQPRHGIDSIRSTHQRPRPNNARQSARLSHCLTDLVCTAPQPGITVASEKLYPRIFQHPNLPLGACGDHLERDLKRYQGHGRSGRLPRLMEHFPLTLLGVYWRSMFVSFMIWSGDVLGLGGSWRQCVGAFCVSEAFERSISLLLSTSIALGWDSRPSNTVLTEGECRIEIAKATPPQPDSRVLPTSNLNDVEMRPQTHVFCSPQPISPENTRFAPPGT
jgi:hypothetical protein